MKPRVAIATGDPAGIGPEISLKAARDPAVLELCRPVLVGDRAVLELHARACGLSLEGIELLPVKQELPELGSVAPSHGRAALAAAEKAIRAALEGRFAAVVGAPHTEAAIHAAGIDFDGYPSFVARVCGLAPEDGILMLCFRHGEREIRIAHVTLHTSVRSALAMITVARVTKRCRRARRAREARFRAAENRSGASTPMPENPAPQAGNRVIDPAEQARRGHHRRQSGRRRYHPARGIRRVCRDAARPEDTSPPKPRAAAHRRAYAGTPSSSPRSATARRSTSPAGPAIPRQCGKP
jgi:hypothetical protein